MNHTGTDTGAQAPPEHRRSVHIVGAGPAGLMAADVISRAGVQAVVHDRAPSPGRKFLLAGRGGLNLTHSEDIDRFLARYGAAASWLAPAIAAFTPAELRDFCRNLGVETWIGTSGRVFPACWKTSPLLRAWLGRLGAAGVEFHMRRRFLGWSADGALRFETPDGEIAVAADAVILALGGASWPKLGGDGGWVGALEQARVRVAPLRAANCGFVADWPEQFGERFAGAPLKNIETGFAGQRQRGECVITRNGLEGGVIYALSAPLRATIDAAGEAILHIDLKPDTAQWELARRLAAQPARSSFANRLRKAARLSPAAIALARQCGPFSGPDEIAAVLKALPVRLIAPQPLDRAISSAGGIVRDALDEHFMLRALPGVFAAGEMLDWEAPTGGYLLQACFATGAAAARGALRHLGEPCP